MITDQQVVLLRQKQKLREGKTQLAAAAASATSEGSVRRWQRGLLPSEKRRNTRSWRTRPDPFADVWASDVEPLLRSDPEGRVFGDNYARDTLNKPSVLWHSTMPEGRQKCLG